MPASRTRDRSGFPAGEPGTRVGYAADLRVPDRRGQSVMRRIRICHVASGDLIAEGPVSLGGITSFEGNFYISRSCLRTAGFRPNWLPGLCIYKFLYVGLDFTASDGTRNRGLGWLYWLPNPLFFFTAFRVAVPQATAALRIEEIA